MPTQDQLTAAHQD